MPRWSFRALVVTLPFLGFASPGAAQYNLYFGNFHAHTNLSDGTGTPAAAYQYARDTAGIDILALTDHTHLLSASEYTFLQGQADLYTDNGTFVALAAQEHGSLSTSVNGAFGHINTWEAASLIDQNTYRYDLTGTYQWIATHVDDTTGRPLSAGFNHPYNTAGAGASAQFADLAYDANGEAAMTFIEVLNGRRSSAYEVEYFQALANGFRVGALGNQDNHSGEWGDQENNIGNIPLTGIWSTALTKADILEAMEARRTFAMEVDPPTDRISLEFRMDGNWMGSEYATSADSVFIEVVVSAEVNISSLQLYRNGTFIKSTGVGAASFAWNTFDTPGPGDFYYLVKVNQSDADRAWSSPIWVESTSEFSLPIATVNEDDASGFPTLWFQNVTVQGLVTVDTDTLDTTNNLVFIQDATGGMMVQEFGMQSVDFVPGDNVLITGTVDTFQGQTFLSAPTSIEILSQGGAPPTPIVLSTNDLATSGETWEGSLVEIHDVAITAGTWPPPGLDGSVTVDDGSGPATLTIDKDTVLDDLGAPVDSTFSVRGILTQKDPSAPYTCCYAILPRYADDIFQIVGVGVSELPAHDATVKSALHPNRPNPVVSFTEIRFDLAGSRDRNVRLDVFDVTGRRVKTLVKGVLPPGEFEVIWDRRSDGGGRVSAGVYFARLVSEDGVDLTQKMVVLD
jgi:hypothetical protein